MQRRLVLSRWGPTFHRPQPILRSSGQGYDTLGVVGDAEEDLAKDGDEGISVIGDEIAEASGPDLA